MRKKIEEKIEIKVKDIRPVPASHGRDLKWAMKPWIWVVLVILAILLFKGSGKFIGGRNIDSSAYQAIFLSNNQVYFGKLKLARDWAELTDVYYLRARQQLQPSPQLAIPSNFELVKLGDELHQPQDKMFIDRDKILFWENLKRDSQISTAIAEFRRRKE